ncbi:MAG: type II toxin-antitoxin system Phd/YefM family antitoxin [Burkholderiaceae bacterium]|nr:type II toxin-antitoxin system Phd/YefM family antitoxin [Burkholderiaceae bacterium]
MKLSTQIKPISYLKSHAADIAKGLSESGEPLVITQNGEAKMVVMGVAEYEEQQETMALLKLIALGEKERKTGQGISISEMKARLAEKRGAR